VFHLWQRFFGREGRVPEKKLQSALLRISLLVGLPILIHIPAALLGLSLDPIWFYSGLVQGVTHGPLSGQPFLDPNVGFSTEALGRLAARDWLSGRPPWWNPYSGVGLPLAGEMQAGAFALPLLFLVLLPEGVLLFKIATMILAGFATYALLRELLLSPLAATVGGLLYELNGSFAWTPGEEVIGGTLAFIPLLLYGIERARRSEGRGSGVVWIALAICGLVYYGFPETAYIAGLLAAFWAIFRWVEGDDRRAFAGRVAYGLLLGLLLSAPLLVAFGDCIFSSGFPSNHLFGLCHLPPQAAVTLFLPYALGTLHSNFGSPVLAAVWGRLGGYGGALLILMAMAGVVGKREPGLRLLLAAWIALAWAKSFGVQPVTALLNFLPGMLDTAFYRYAPPVWGLALVILAAFVLDEAWEEKTHIPAWVYALFALLLAASVLMAWPGWSFWRWPEGPSHAAFKALLRSLLSSSLGLGLVVWAWRALRGERRRFVLSALLLAEACGLFVVPTLSGVHPGRLDEGLLHYLKGHLGLSRFYTLGPFQPNYGAAFQLASLNYNYLPVAYEWELYVRHHLFPLLQASRGSIFWPSWPRYPAVAGRECLLDHLKRYEEMGVKYVVADADDDPFRPSPQHPLDGNFRRLSEDSRETASQNETALAHRVYQDELVSVWELRHPAPYFEVEDGRSAILTPLSREQVRVQSTTSVTLLRRELFDPGWRVKIDGRRAGLFRSGPIFQAVRLPAGTHEVSFIYAPPHETAAWMAASVGLLALFAEALLAVRPQSRDGRRNGSANPHGSSWPA
jgi:hypothetical protein